MYTHFPSSSPLESSILLINIWPKWYTNYPLKVRACNVYIYAIIKANETRVFDQSTNMYACTWIPRSGMLQFSLPFKNFVLKIYLLVLSNKYMYSCFIFSFIIINAYNHIDRAQLDIQIKGIPLYPFIISVYNIYKIPYSFISVNYTTHIGFTYL